MAKEHCSIHTTTEMIIVKYCPACRGSEGGKKASDNMTKQERKERAQKAIQARWKRYRKVRGLD